MTQKPWTYPEITRMRNLRIVERKAFDAIGRELDRSTSSVKGKFFSMGGAAMIVALRKPTPAPLIETMAVFKTEVVRLYELGWRFDGFSSAGLCIMSKKTQLRVSLPRDDVTQVICPTMQRSDLEVVV